MAQAGLNPALARAHQEYLGWLALRRAGREREGRPRLHQAASAGHPGALYSLAVIEYEGPERDIAGAAAKLASAAGQGHSASRQMLAVIKAKNNDWRGAIELVIEGGRAGDPSSERDLGLMLEMGRPGHPSSGKLLFKAACADDVMAIFAIVGRAVSGSTALSASDVSYWTHALRQVKHPRAHRLPAPSAEGQRPQMPSPFAESFWQEMRLLLQQQPASARSRINPISRSPQIFEVKNVLTLEECDFLIGLATPLLKDAKVYNNITGKLEIDPVRTALEASLWPSNLTLAAHCLNVRMAAAADAPVENGETTNILMYRPRDEFRPHYDFFANTESVPDFAKSGQRARTLLVYLNADYVGGQTHFLASDLRYRGDPGDAVLFFNTDATGAPDQATLHAGLPVEHGVKWLVSKWFRERPYWC